MEYYQSLQIGNKPSVPLQPPPPKDCYQSQGGEYYGKYLGKFDVFDGIYGTKMVAIGTPVVKTECKYSSSSGFGGYEKGGYRKRHRQTKSKRSKKSKRAQSRKHKA